MTTRKGGGGGEGGRAGGEERGITASIERGEKRREKREERREHKHDGATEQTNNFPRCSISAPAIIPRRLLLPRFHLGVLASVEKDLVPLVLRRPGGPLGPVVAAGVGKDVSVRVEVAARDRDRPLRLHKLLQPLPTILVPEVVRPVRPRRGERAVDRVERNAVDRVHVIGTLGRLLPPPSWHAVALERKILGRFIVLNVPGGGMDATREREREELETCSGL